MASQDPAMMAGAAPTAQTAQPDQDQTATLVIEVSLFPDGHIEVEKETGAQEEAEEAGTAPGAPEQEETGAAAPTTVKDSAEAGQVVQQMLDEAQQSTPEKAANTKAQQQAGYQGM